MNNQPQLHLLQTQQDIDALVERLQTSKTNVVSFDTETTGVHFGAEIIGLAICDSSKEAFYVITKRWDKATQTLLSMPVEVEGILEVLKTKALVMHNGVFDCSMVENNYKVKLTDRLYHDTMVAAHVLDENGPLGLKQLGRGIVGDSATKEKEEMDASIEANGGSITKKNYELYKGDSDLIGKYGAKDAWLTRELFQIQIKDLKKQGLEQFFREESMPLLRTATYDMNTVGLKLDLEKMAKLKKTLELECVDADHEINRHIFLKIQEKYPGTSKKNSFNKNSNAQLAWLIFGEFGLPFDTLTEEGKSVAEALNLPKASLYTAAGKRTFIETCARLEGTQYIPDVTVNGRLKKGKKIKSPWAYVKCDKKTLLKHAESHAWIKTLLDVKRKTKLLTTYIKGLESRVQYGILRPSFLQTGTTSGRYSSRNPNFQNLPRDDKRIKECIVARRGKKFVGADFSQLEPRVFASVSGDENLMKAFKSSEDFYSVIGMRVYGKTDCTPHKDGSPEAFGVKYKKLRNLAKVIALASTYGATAFRLMEETKKSKEDTQADIDAYFEAFPNVKNMMTESHRTAIAEGQVKTLFGRVRRLPEAKRMSLKEYDAAPSPESFPYQYRTLLNLAVNHRIQGAGASICNRAMINFYTQVKERGIKDCHIVCQVHDEIITECREEDAAEVSDILRFCMEKTTALPGVELEAIPNIASNFADLK